MRLIKLTEIVSKKIGIKQERYFNVDKIETIISADDCSFLITNTDTYRVKETPEEIIELIKQAKEI